VADSACSATAYLCGVKANIDTIGVDANVLLNDCEAMNKPEFRVDSIMTWAQVRAVTLISRGMLTKLTFRELGKGRAS
jgi:alkaline phosphatase